MEALTRQAGQPPSGSKEHGRLQFLDAARGLAVIAVVVQHAFEFYVPGVTHWAGHHFNFGAFGVVVFFLVSGFIIPVSLLRTGNLRAFWLNRFFRLYPMYWTSLGFALLTALWLHWRTLDPAIMAHPWRAGLANVTMLQMFLGVPDVEAVYWTLVLELVFYMLCSLLFLLGWLRRSLALAWLAVGGLGLIAAFAGLGLHRSLPVGRLGMLVTAFVGLVFWGVANGSVSTRRLGWLLLGTSASFAVSFWYRFRVYPVPGEPWSYAGVCASWGAGYATFLIFFALREKTFPEWTIWLGRISYSLYLVHAAVLETLRLPYGAAIKIPVAVFLSVSVSTLTYRYIERPALRFHKRHLSRT